MKIKILHMVRELEIGGIQSLIINIYEHIDKEEFQFDFLVSSKGVLDEKLKKMGSKIFYTPYITEVGPYKYSKNLEKFFLEHTEYKIIHLHFDQFSGLIAKISRKMGIKVIISHAHIMNNTTNFLGKLYKKYLQKDLIKYSTNYLACSRSAAQWLFKEMANEAIILKNGINIEKFKFDVNERKKIRQQLGIDETTIVYGNIGRLSKEKNQEFVIKIFQELCKVNNDSVLIIVGEGDLRKKLERKIKNLNLQDKILLLGNRKNVASIYSAMDILIFPSLFEGLGIALIEAQMCGVQCYASSIIPKETNITKHIKYIDLKCSAKEWANIILNNELDVIECRLKKTISNSDYDIKNTAKFLTDFYKKAMQGEDDEKNN